MDSALRAHFLRCLEYDILLVPVTGRPTNWTYIARTWRGGPKYPASLRDGLRRRAVLGR